MPESHKTYTGHTGRGTLHMASSPATSKDTKHREEEARRTERVRQRIEKNTLEEEAFLEYVAQNPGISPELVRQALGMHPNPGYATLEVLEVWGFIQKVTGRPSGKGGAPISLFVTQEGQNYLRELRKKTDKPQTNS